MRCKERILRAGLTSANLLLGIALSSSPAVAGFCSVTAVPAPSSLSLLGVGVAAVGAFVIRKLRK